MRLMHLFFCTLLVGLLIGCVSRRSVQTDLYFGLSQPDGQLITDSAWNRFASEQIAAVLPDGFTVISGSGRWKESASDSLRSEPSRLVVTVNHMNNRLSAAIDSLRKRYCQRFHQQSVLRTDRRLKVSF